MHRSALLLAIAVLVLSFSSSLSLPAPNPSQHGANDRRFYQSQIFQPVYNAPSSGDGHETTDDTTYSPNYGFSTREDISNVGRDGVASAGAGAHIGGEVRAQDAAGIKLYKRDFGDFFNNSYFSQARDVMSGGFESLKSKFAKWTGK